MNPSDFLEVLYDKTVSDEVILTSAKQMIATQGAGYYAALLEMKQRKPTLHAQLQKDVDVAQAFQE